MSILLQLPVSNSQTEHNTVLHSGAKWFDIWPDNSQREAHGVISFHDVGPCPGQVPRNPWHMCAGQLPDSLRS